MPERPAIPRAAVVLVGAGSGARVGAKTNKVLLPLLGVPVLAWSLRTLRTLPYVDRVVVVVRPGDTARARELVRWELRGDQRAVLVDGGATRHDSEWRGLRTLRTAVEAGELEVIAVHDAARPLAGAGLFDTTVRVAHEHGGAVPVRGHHALVSIDGGRRVRGLVGVQTPQAFRAGALLEAYTHAAEDGFTATDTAGCVATYTDLVIRAVASSATNLKITFPEDLAVAERLLLRGQGTTPGPGERAEGGQPAAETPTGDSP